MCRCRPDEGEIKNLHVPADVIWKAPYDTQLEEWYFTQDSFNPFNVCLAFWPISPGHTTDYKRMFGRLTTEGITITEKIPKIRDDQRNCIDWEYAGGRIYELFTEKAGEQARNPALVYVMCDEVRIFEKKRHSAEFFWTATELHVRLWQEKRRRPYEQYSVNEVACFKIQMWIRSGTKKILTLHFYRRAACSTCMFFRKPIGGAFPMKELPT